MKTFIYNFNGDIYETNTAFDATYRAKKKEAELLSSNMDEDDNLLLDTAFCTFNFVNYIESLEWKVDLKILHAANDLLIKI